MENIELYDPSNVFSIKKFADQLLFCSSNANFKYNCLDSILYVTINALKKNEKYNYDNIEVSQLLRLMANVCLYCKSEEIEVIIKLDLHEIYSEIVRYKLTQWTIDLDILDAVFTSLNNLTYQSLPIALLNIKHNFHVLTVLLMQRVNFVEAHKSNNNELFALYETFLLFLQSNSYHPETRDALKTANLVEHLRGDLEKLNCLSYPRVEIKYVTVVLLSIVASLLDDNQLETLMIANEIVRKFLVTLEDLIKQSKTNQRPIDNTMLYIRYKMYNTYTYIKAYRHLKCIISIANNFTIKQKLFNGGILESLNELLIHGNEDEVDATCELICSLCLNDCVVNSMKKSQELTEFIEKLQHTTARSSTKNSCRQIIQILNKQKQNSILH